MNYAGDRDAGEAVVAQIESAGGTAAAVRADVSEPGQAGALIAAAAELGSLAALVDNSGLSSAVGRLDEQDDDGLSRLVDVNVRGVLLTCREAVRVLSTAHRAGRSWTSRRWRHAPAACRGWLRTPPPRPR